MVSILIGGDISPGNRYEALFENGDSEGIFGDLLEEFKEADLVLANLECPLTNTSTPILKTGPNLCASERCVQGIKVSGIDAVNLANNHILDYGSEGLVRTLKACNGAGIDTFGAGANITEAREFYIREINGLRIAISGMAEREWSTAGEKQAGAAPLDLIDFADLIRANSGQYDRLVVLVHGGIEDYPYPTPQMRKHYRFLVDLGADAVICQHTHVAGCYELHNSAPIIYGQGNLVFDRNIQALKSWTEGALVRLTLDLDTPIEVSFTPFHQPGDSPGVRRMDAGSGDRFLSAFHERSENIMQPGFIEAEWGEFCRKQAPGYLRRTKRYRRWLDILVRKTGIEPSFIDDTWLLSQLHHVRNDSYREMHEKIFEQLVRRRFG